MTTEAINNDWASIGVSTTPLPETSPIVHRILSLKQTINATTGTGPVTFVLSEPSKPPTVGISIGEYLNLITDKGIDRSPGPATPFDIKLLKQCFVILELHGDVNWEFTPTSKGLSAKAGEITDEDADLMFVTEHGLVGPGQPTPSACKILYWSVIKRLPNKQRGFNFHVDFVQVTGGRELRLPTIFDPNVPNTGGPAIP